MRKMSFIEHFAILSIKLDKRKMTDVVKTAVKAELRTKKYGQILI